MTCMEARNLTSVDINRARIWMDTTTEEYYKDQSTRQRSLREDKARTVKRPAEEQRRRHADEGRRLEEKSEI